MYRILATRGASTDPKTTQKGGLGLISRLSRQFQSPRAPDHSHSDKRFWRGNDLSQMSHRSLTSVTSFPKHTRTQRPRGASEPSVRICSHGGQEGFWAFPASFGPSETSALLPHQNEICQDRAWVPSRWRRWGLHTASAMEKPGPHTSGSQYPGHHRAPGEHRSL